jgi:uncharacterized protein YbaP (TraB family)
LLGDRNRNWQAQLALVLNDTASHMIVVGAGHCVGPQGLVAQLLARGVVVTPMAPQAQATSSAVVRPPHRP